MLKQFYLRFYPVFVRENMPARQDAAEEGVNDLPVVELEPHRTLLRKIFFSFFGTFYPIQFSNRSHKYMVVESAPGSLCPVER